MSTEKVEVELPRLPDDMEYVPAPVEAEIRHELSSYGVCTMQVAATFAVRTRTPPFPAPEGYEFTGEYRCPKRGELLLNFVGNAEPAWVDFHNDKCWILRKKKPTYTEAVKAAGWKWPEDLHPRYTHITPHHYRIHNYRPGFINGRWDKGDGWQTLDVAIKWPPTLGYPEAEAILCRDDFI